MTTVNVHSTGGSLNKSGYFQTIACSETLQKFTKYIYMLWPINIHKYSQNSMRGMNINLEKNVYTLDMARKDTHQLYNVFYLTLLEGVREIELQGTFIL